MAIVPLEYRYVVEFRDQTWFEPSVRELLASKNVAFCIHDYPKLRVPHWVTRDDLAYLRFHNYYCTLPPPHRKTP